MNKITYRRKGLRLVHTYLSRTTGHLDTHNHLNACYKNRSVQVFPYGGFDSLRVHSIPSASRTAFLNISSKTCWSS